jgi:hypothetical protein
MGTQTCPGMKSLRIIGRPLIKDSAIVPGPAYGTNNNMKGKIRNGTKICNRSNMLKYEWSRTYLCYNTVTSSHPLLHLGLKSPNLLIKNEEQKIYST